MHYARSLLAAGMAQSALAAYTLKDDYSGNNFFNMVNFFTGPDPTQGYVNFLDQGTAQAQGLAKVNEQGQVYLGVDSTSQTDPNGAGRNSVRVASNAAYTHYLTVIDLAHMPGGQCGSWPAFWSFGSPDGWPNDGEIDIIEGVNSQSANFMSLHTNANCAITDGNGGIAQPTSLNCDVAANGNTGCSIHASDPTTYGTGFNQNNGGIYATDWTSNGINIFFWPHGQQPGDVLSDAPNPAGWGQPLASFGGTGCDWDAHFKEHNLIFDLTFCGAWAGADFPNSCGSTGASSCNAYVAQNPQAFADTYFLVNSLKVYQDDGAAPAAAPGVSKRIVDPAKALEAAASMGERRMRRAQKVWDSAGY